MKIDKVLLSSFLGALLGGILFYLLLIFVAPSLDPAARSTSAPIPPTWIAKAPPLPFILSTGTVVDVKKSKWRLRSLDSSIVKFSDFSGKTMFVNYWGTWCKPCVEEMPYIQALYDSLSNDHVAFVVFSDEDIETIRYFANRNGYTVPFYQSLSEPPAKLVNKVWPTTFILNPSGSIVWSDIGGWKWDDPSAIRFLRNLDK